MTHIFLTKHSPKFSAGAKNLGGIHTSSRMFIQKYLVTLILEGKIKTKMAALNRSAFFALRLSSSIPKGSKAVKPFSTTSSWLADSGLTKKVDSEDILKVDLDRKKKLAGLITVEGEIDVGTTSVS